MLVDLEQTVKHSLKQLRFWKAVNYTISVLHLQDEFDHAYILR